MARCSENDLIKGLSFILLMTCGFAMGGMAIGNYKDTDNFNDGGHITNYAVQYGVGGVILGASLSVVILLSLFLYKCRKTEEDQQLLQPELTSEEPKNCWGSLLNFFPGAPEKSANDLSAPFAGISANQSL